MITQGIGTKRDWIRLEFAIDGVVQTQRFIQGFDVKIHDFEIPFLQFGRHMLKHFAVRFRKESGRAGWQQLAESTVKARAKGYGYYGTYPGRQASRHPILEWTGTLKKSYTVQGAWGNIFDIEKNSLRIGSALKYAIYHHRGGRHLPKREVAFFTTADNTYLVKLFHKQILRLIKRERGGVPQTPTWTQ